VPTRCRVIHASAWLANGITSRASAESRPIALTCSHAQSAWPVPSSCPRCDSSAPLGNWKPAKFSAASRAYS
jgi:hypothetical protein